jgi:hypothetical protein
MFKRVFWGVSLFFLFHPFSAKGKPTTCADVQKSAKELVGSYYNMISIDLDHLSEIEKTLKVAQCNDDNCIYFFKELNLSVQYKAAKKHIEDRKMHLEKLCSTSNPPDCAEVRNVFAQICASIRGVFAGYDDKVDSTNPLVKTFLQCVDNPESYRGSCGKIYDYGIALFRRDYAKKILEKLKEILSAGQLAL